MKPIINSFLMYLLIVGLLTVNLYFVSDFPLSAYIIYIVLILVVYYSSKSLSWGERLAPGLLSGAALMGAVFSIEIIAGWVRIEGFDFNPDFLIPIIIFQLLVAAGEELSFRGYILKNLIADTGIKNGISLSSFMFAAIHLPSFIYYGLDISRGAIAFIVVGLLSAIVSIIYLNYGLWSAISFHFAWNFLQYYVFNLSDNQQGIMIISYTVRNLLTGGNYGPEAGILGFIVVLSGLIIFIKKYTKSLNQASLII
ncbi:MAG: CPBP family intramembrane glutamic endopeptidase [Candidatus Methanoperedens sp.]